MKIQGQEKDKLIEDLRQSVRMSRVEELENEMLQYMQECGRLRSQLQLDKVLTNQNNEAIIGS